MKKTLSLLGLIPTLTLLVFIQSCSGGGSTASTSSSSSKSIITGYNKQDLVVDLANQLTTAYAILDFTTTELESQSETFCTDTNSTEEFDTLKAKWVTAMLAWQYVQGINFGPAYEDTRLSRMSFYPIHRSVMQTRIDDLINDTDSITIDIIQNQGASLQGFVALEYVLFRDNALTRINDSNTLHCQFIISVANNLTSMTTPMAEAWATGGAYYKNFISNTNTQQSLEDWIKAINLHVTIIQKKVTSGNLSEIESPLAQISILNIKENIRFLKNAFTMTSDSGIDQVLKNLDVTSIADEMRNRLSIAETSLAAVNDSVTILNDSNAGIAELDKLVEEIHNIQEDLAIDVADALGISIIFNGADGD